MYVITDLLAAVFVCVMSYYLARIALRLEWKPGAWAAGATAAWNCTPLLLDIVWHVPNWYRAVVGLGTVAGALVFYVWANRASRRGPTPE